MAQEAEGQNHGHLVQLLTLSPWQACYGRWALQVRGQHGSVVEWFSPILKVAEPLVTMLQFSLSKMLNPPIAPDATSSVGKWGNSVKTRWISKVKQHCKSEILFPVASLYWPPWVVYWILQQPGNKTLSALGQEMKHYNAPQANLIVKLKFAFAMNVSKQLSLQFANAFCFSFNVSGFLSPAIFVYYFVGLLLCLK